VLDAVTELAASLTPAPVAAPLVADRFAGSLQGWRSLRDAQRRGVEDLTDVDPWVARHLPALATLEAGWADAAAGRSLIHADLRADNVLLTRDRVFILDWAWACVGAPWFDLVSMLPSVHLQAARHHPSSSTPTRPPATLACLPDLGHGRL
jgi:aminoglycoside phosphotransferase (APT) family kinase protein